MKKFFLCAWLFSAAFSHSFAQQKVNVSTNTVIPSEILDNGQISKKIYLKNAATPTVRLSNIKTVPVTALPEGAKASSSFEADVLRSTERKKQIAFINIPAYRKVNGQLEMLVSYDLEITELDTDPGDGNTAQRPTLADNSVLATGTWYKIAIGNRGVFKIDYNFLQSIGANPATINPANIRVYGNGGTVLPEKANSTQPDDLIENAVFVSSTGSTFGQNDYILFYANGPVLWSKDSLNKKFVHTNNYYENNSYYFLNFDLGPGKRISAEPATGAAAATYTSFDEYAVIDLDSFNVGMIGKVWWSNRMSSVNTASQTQNLNIDLGPIAGPVTLETTVGNTNDAGNNNLQLRVNSALVNNFTLAANGVYTIMDAKTESFVLSPASGNLNIQFKYSPNGNGAAYIDYLRFNYKKNLTLAQGQVAFREWGSAGLGAGQKAAFRIQNANAGTRVWEITNPLNPVALEGSLAGSEYTIAREGNRLREFVAFDGSQFYTPVALTPSLIENQNLHGLSHTDFLIVTRKDLLPAAEELAEFHRQRDNITVTVATLDKIYNEFSSGGQDIGGIRNFIKMFYDRADNEEDMIKNVLFFGAASYDYKNRLPFNTNVVPTFETYQSVSGTQAYSSDDYFALLDDGDDINGTAVLDIGTGRIPAYDNDEALKAVAKIKNYASPNSFGPWKNVVTYVADDKDLGVTGMNHLNDCEEVSNFFNDSDRLYNVYKLYADAYPIVAAPGGGRYPAVNKAINDQIYNGTFLMSYSGHGSPDRWAHEAILAPDDYGSWKNKNMLPVMVTATCDFGRFDDPGQRSAGARLMINPNGGSIAMITTTQVVYQNQNTALNKAYTNKQFTPIAPGKFRTLGEALKDAKNSYSGGENNHKYVVLGDPALKLQIPVHKVVTDKLYLDDGGTTTETDTIKALGKYELTGRITDKDNNTLTDFNGVVYITVFDKARAIQTVNPDVNVTPSFMLQTNIAAKVKGSVENGIFSVNFIAPKDINYDYGFGKISYYANSSTTDASGLDTNYTVGGYNPNAPEDNEGPVVQPYIDNDKFRDGGVTGPNPLLYVKLFDEHGINVSGSAVGHDLIAVLDDDVQNPFIMNNYYQSEQNDYRKGYVNFPMYNLPDGMHTIRVRAWDVYNNSSEGTVTFEVRNKEKGFISDLYNYPNPVTDFTHIVFQHNQEGEEMDVTLQLFSSTGSLVRTLTEHIETTGNRTEMVWDGLGDGGIPLTRGIYFYRLNVKTGKGSRATAYQKLVLLR
jgi:hypothetical protein